MKRSRTRNINRTKYKSKMEKSIHNNRATDAKLPKKSRKSRKSRMREKKGGARGEKLDGLDGDYYIYIKNPCNPAYDRYNIQYIDITKFYGDQIVYPIQYINGMLLNITDYKICEYPEGVKEIKGELTPSDDNINKGTITFYVNSNLEGTFNYEIEKYTARQFKNKSIEEFFSQKDHKEQCSVKLERLISDKHGRSITDKKNIVNFDRDFYPHIKSKLMRASRTKELDSSTINIINISPLLTTPL